MEMEERDVLMLRGNKKWLEIMPHGLAIVLFFACNHHQGGDSFGFRSKISIAVRRAPKQTKAVGEHCGSRTDTASSSVIRHNSYGGEGWSLGVS